MVPMPLPPLRRGAEEALALRALALAQERPAGFALFRERGFRFF